MDPVSQTSQVKVDGLEVKAPASADIFVACASDAGEWAERFIDMLTRPGARVDSAAEGTRSSVRQKPGSQRYAAFVALVTPEYVANNEAGIDTSAFIGPGGGGTRRFAVHLRSAPWQELPWMARFTLLPADGSAVLDADDPDRVLAEIAESVRAQVDASAAESPRDAIPSTAGESPLDALLARYPMEEAVREIFVMAYSIASSHQPPRPLGSSLLMSSAALTRNVLDPAQQWLSDQLGTERMEGLVREALSASGRMPAEVFSVGASAIVDGAAVIAREASGTPSICVRHLVGSLITTQTGALAYVQARGLTAEELRERYFAFVQNQGDDDAAWARTLGLPLSEPRLLAHFDADDSRSEDFLDVRPDVLAFAGLIAARTLTPPLSIGLFGEWGSGKTFFMRMLRREVDRLAQQADASSAMQRDLPFWKRIIQIEFNAWHYTEGNLWASLVQHIFENLRFADEPRLSASQELQKHLLDQIGHEKQAEQQARREKDEAERLVAEARQAVASARQAYEDEARRLAALSAENLLADVPVPAIRQEAAGALKALGLDRVGSSALELRTALGEARTLLGRGRAVAAPLLHGEERRRRWWFLVMALFAGPAVAMALRVLLEGIGPEGLDTIGAWSAGVATFLSSVAAWIRAQLAKAGEWIQQVEDAQRRLDETVARAQAQNVQQMREAEERLRLREADYQAARRREEEAQRRAVEARQRLSEASLAGVLSTFIEDRASSTDYRKHLGTLALVRNDFERLSALIEEENWRLSPPVPGEDTARRGLAKFATPEEERADRARRINRIVLYVDDLDRCPPAKVVEVLQAVHLLLAFPLFVVVVGVDARWITRSLEARYRELLSVDARAGEVDEFRELFGSATAHDYLEKIFQVPFWLRPMGDDGARAMVGGLLAPSLAAPSKSEASPSSTNVVQEQQDESGAGEREGPRLPVPGSTGDDKGIVLGRPAEVERAEVPAKREEPELTAESLEITQSELQFMNELAPLLGRSPRALKRFVNVYRLIKAGLPPHERRAFLRDDRGASDYQAVLFLLAVDTGAPHIASRLFQAFTTILAPDGRGKAGEEQVKFVVSQIDGELDGDADWWRVKGWLQSEPGTHRFEPRAMETIARWVPRISRFSFHTGRVPSTLPGLGPDEEAPQG